MDWINTLLPFVTTFVGAYLGYLGTKHTADKNSENQRLKFEIELEKQKNELEKINNEKSIKIAELENEIKKIEANSSASINHLQQEKMLEFMGPLFMESLKGEIPTIIQEKLTTAIKEGAMFNEKD